MVDSPFFLKLLMSFEGNFINKLKSAMDISMDKKFIKTVAYFIILVRGKINNKPEIYYYGNGD